ncbi:MAG: hypothetical protein J7K98_00065 [Candidatus Aenigmarchaeota archaeon]|nr:hypothetical protein [Candidatus Aenigmarchaeota archaeon]
MKIFDEWIAKLFVVSTIFSLLNYFILSTFGFTRLTILLISEVPGLMSLVLIFFNPKIVRKSKAEE